MATAQPTPAQVAARRRRRNLEFRLLNTVRLTIPHAVAGANQNHEYIQTNSHNSDLRCLWHVFARGYYENSAASHQRFQHVRDRVAVLWDHVVGIHHPDNPARQDRGGLYHLMLENSRTGRDSIVSQLRTGDWGTLDIVQLLADAFDVEIYVHIPTNIVATQNLPVVTQWQLQVRGDRHPPNRQIHIVNWMNAYHWTLLEPLRRRADPDVIDPSDPVLPDHLRTPVPGQRDDPVPPPLRRYPLGHAIYNQMALVAKDIPHIPDVDAIQPRSDNAGDGPVDVVTGLPIGHDAVDGHADVDSSLPRGNDAVVDNRPVVTVAEDVMSRWHDIRVVHGKTPDNAGLPFTQLHVAAGPLALYRAFARVYYGRDPQDQTWHTVVSRVLRLWNAVMSPNRRDSLARRSRVALYTAMRQQNEHLEYELAGAREASLDVVQLIADAYGVNIYVHSPVGASANADQTATAQSWLLNWRGEHHSSPGTKPLSFNLVHYRATNDWTGLRRPHMSASNINQDPLGYYTSHDTIVQPLPGHPAPQPLQRLQPGRNRRDRELGVPDDYEIVQIVADRRDSSNDSDEPKKSSSRRLVSRVIKRAKSILTPRPRRGSRQRIRTRTMAIPYDPTPRDGDLSPAARPKDTPVPGAQHGAGLLSQSVGNAQDDVPDSSRVGTGRTVHFATGSTPPAQDDGTHVNADSPNAVVLQARAARRREQAAKDALETARAEAIKAADRATALVGQGGITPPTTPGANLRPQGVQPVTPASGADPMPQPAVLPTPPATAGNAQTGTKRNGDDIVDQPAGKRARVESADTGLADNNTATQGSVEERDHGAGPIRGRVRAPRGRGRFRLFRGRGHGPFAPGTTR
ncbi:hypothetical protein BDV97DRAFT_396610 [Delphinella strobiligena]|nr:hypothetical protein BDV97DRAFT_396610 [Delphinella strobiligena]